MAYIMSVSLKRTKSGYQARKGIPKDVRMDYQRLYGAGWEAKFLAPPTWRQPEAKARFNEWLAEVETRIQTIRAQRTGEGQQLTTRDGRALAGEWYVWFVARHEDNPGAPKRWRTLLDVLISQLEEYAFPEGRGHPWRDLETRDPEVLSGIRPALADEAKTAQFLASRGLVLSQPAHELFVDCVLDEFIEAVLLLERRAEGDYSADERPQQFPKFNGGRLAASGALTPWQLFEAWNKAKEPAPSTISRWRVVFLDLEKRFSNDAISEEAARD